MLFQPGLEAVRDCYFCPSTSGIRSYLSQIAEHSKTVFESIDSDIRLKDVTIKIPRRDLDLESFLRSNANYLLIHGESGTGKSGWVKDRLQNETKFPVFIFRATDFDVPSVSEFSRKFGECTFEDFLAGFDRCQPQRLCIIDSAEKVFTVNYQDTLLSITNLFIQHGWKIIVTIRTAFKDDFVNSILHTADCQEHELRRITAEELSRVESTYGLALPIDTKLRDLLRNLFYLKLYVSSATKGSSPGDSVERFITRIWDELVRNVATKKDNLDIRREDAICTIVLSNANEGVSYYAHHQGDDDEAISALAQSGIIAYDKTMVGCYVTHDVYEELVLKHIMRTAFNRKQSCEDFFSKAGNSLVVRKAFRLWLHDVLEAQLDEVSGFIVEALNSAHVEPTWKDDVLIALMSVFCIF